MSITEQPGIDDAHLMPITLETVDKVMNTVDDVCRENNLDASAMIYMSVQVAAHLLSRGLIFANGPHNRMAMRNKLLEGVTDMVDEALEHIDQSESELEATGVRINQ